MIEEIPDLVAHRDERGDVLDFGAFSPERLHIVSLVAGAVRGNHAHNRDEIICVIGGSGKCEIVAEDERCGEVQRVIVEGNLKTYRIKAGVKHTFKNFGEDTFFLVCFYGSISSSS